MNSKFALDKFKAQDAFNFLKRLKTIAIRI